MTQDRLYSGMFDSRRAEMLNLLMGSTMYSAAGWDDGASSGTAANLLPGKEKGTLFI